MGNAVKGPRRSPRSLPETPLHTPSPSNHSPPSFALVPSSALHTRSPASSCASDESVSLRSLSEMEAGWELDLMLPCEILEHIFHWCSLTTLINVQAVCRSWWIVVRSSPLWRTYALQLGHDIDKLKERPHWQSVINVTKKIASAKARLEVPIKAHVARTSFLYTHNNYLITVGSNQMLDKTENQWDLSSKAFGLVSDERMHITLSLWNPLTGTLAASFPLVHQINPKIVIQDNLLFTCGTSGSILVWDFDKASIVANLMEQVPNSLRKYICTIMGFHVMRTEVLCVAGRDVLGSLLCWRRDRSSPSLFSFVGLLECESQRFFNWLDGDDETIVLSSKQSIHLWNRRTNAHSIFSVKHQVFSSTAKVEKGMLFVEQGGHSMNVYDIAQQTLRCVLFKSQRILQVNNNLRVSENYAFVTDMGKIRVFDLDSGALVQTIEAPMTYFLVSGLQVSGNYLIFAVVDHGLLVWNWREGKQIAAHPQKIFNSTFSQSGDLVLIGHRVYVSSIFHGDIDVWRFGASMRKPERKSDCGTEHEPNQKTVGPERAAADT